MITPILNNKTIESRTIFILKCVHGNITNQEIKYSDWLLGGAGVSLVTKECATSQKGYVYRRNHI